MASESDNYQATTTAKHPKKVITKTSKRLQMFKVCAIVLFTAVSAILTIVDVVVTAQNLKQKLELENDIAHGIKVTCIIHNLQNERSQAAMFLASAAWNTSKNVLKLQKIRHSTDDSVESLTHWRYTLPGTVHEIVTSSASFLDEIRHVRSKTDRYDNLLLQNHIRVFSSWIHALISWLARYTVAQDFNNHADDLFAYHMIVNSKEELELEKTFGAIHYLLGKNFTVQNTTLYNEKRVRGQAFLESAKFFSSVVKQNYLSLIKETNASTLIEEIDLKRRSLIVNGLVKSSTKDAMVWFDLMTKYADLMLRLEINDANRIESHVKKLINEAVLWLVIRSLLVCFAVIAVPLIIVSLVRFQTKFYKYAHSLHHKVGLEQSRTDFLMRENARYVEDLASRWKQFSQSSSEAQCRLPKRGQPS